MAAPTPAAAPTTAVVAAPPRPWLALIERWPMLAAFTGGAVATLALPPVHFWPALLAFALLLHLVRRAERRSAGFALGWAFGFGHFLFGLYWIAIAFFTDAERFGALALPAVVLLAAYLAVWPALAAGLVGLRRWRHGALAALALALTWTAGEALRGVVFGGFPWILTGYALGRPLALGQLAAVTGVLGLSLLAVALGALPASLLGRADRARWWPPLAGAAVVAVVVVAGALRLVATPTTTLPDVRLRLVQGNIAQHHKWQPELIAGWFERQLELSARPGQPSHIIWPESATPYRLERDPVARQMIARVVPEGGYVITGGERFDLEQQPPRAWNSLFVVDGDGQIRARYDKADLVPFGEFLPLRDLLGALGLGKLTAGAVDFQAGPGRQTVSLPGLPPFSPLICYEAILAGQAVAAGERPDWLLAVTNDAWFGISAGPHQHFAMARMRAIEEGLALVRSANTGISAVVDPLGRVTARLDLGQMGVVDADLPAPLAPPPFARFGHQIIAWLVGLSALVILLLEAPWRRRHSGG